MSPLRNLMRGFETDLDLISLHRMAMWMNQDHIQIHHVCVGRACDEQGIAGFQQGMGIVLSQKCRRIQILMADAFQSESIGEATSGIGWAILAIRSRCEQG